MDRDEATFLYTPAAGCPPCPGRLPLLVPAPPPPPSPLPGRLPCRPIRPLRRPLWLLRSVEVLWPRGHPGRHRQRGRGARPRVRVLRPQLARRPGRQSAGRQRQRGEVSGHTAREYGAAVTCYYMSACWQSLSLFWAGRECYGRASTLPPLSAFLYSVTQLLSLVGTLCCVSSR